MTSNHCFYFALNKIIEANENQNIDYHILFHALGGHQITIRSNSNKTHPTVEVRGNVYDYENFQRYTGLGIRKNIQQDEEHTINLLKKGKKQLVFANCFYLPYDETNFQKISDEHMVIIENYLPDKDLFVVSDVKYQQVTISPSDLQKARREVVNKSNMYFTLKRINKDIDFGELSEQLQLIIQSNALHFNKNIKNAEKALRESLQQIDKCEPLFKKLAAKLMYRSFKHPNGLISTRFILKESLERYGLYPGVADLYELLATQWESFANDLMRFGKGKVSLEEMLKKVEQLICLEKETNNQFIL